MPLKRTTAPATEPVTLARAKLHLREDLTDVDNDAYITDLITVARQACEDRLERSLITQGWTLTLDSFPSAIELRMGPALAVTSVKYLNAAGTELTLDPQDYLVDIASNPGYVVPGVGKAWPDTQDRINAVTVVYTAGYGAAVADVPAPVKQWILLAIADMYGKRERSSERPAVVQGFADSLLDAYRNWSL
jgi:uncharacterized phiE125 gp8 family phage protein